VPNLDSQPRLSDAAWVEIVLLDRHASPNLIDEFVLADPFTVGLR
jgi:hypothetical protein